MKLNKLLILTAITGLAFTSCENEMKQDPELDVVATGDGVNYDGQTITVQKGTPITFQLGGENDFLTFFSGEAGSKYEYKDRAQVATDQIESSKLTLDIKTEYGKLDMIDFKVLIPKTFEGLNKSNFEADSILVEQHDGWQTLLSTADLPNPTSTKSYELDMLPYLGERVALAFVYKGVDNSQTQPKVYIQNLQIVNQMTDGTSSSLAASSLGFTPLNMMYKHNLSDQKSMTSNRPYGTVSNNTSGIWNLSNISSFFIHSSGGGSPLKYSWLTSNLFMVNACTPDAGTPLKNISQSLDSYTYTYTEAGTYTATFVATNGNYDQQKRITREFTVKVTE